MTPVMNAQGSYFCTENNLTGLEPVPTNKS